MSVSTNVGTMYHYDKIRHGRYFSLVRQGPGRQITKVEVTCIHTTPHNSKTKKGYLPQFDKT